MTEWNRNTVTFRAEIPGRAKIEPPSPSWRAQLRIRKNKTKWRIIDTINVARHGLPDPHDY